MSKAIDKQDARVQRYERAIEFTEWMRATGITARQIDEATGSNMGGHYLTAESQPAVATAAMFDRLRPLLPEVPERIEELVRERTVESENMKAREVVGRRSGSTMPGFAKIADGEPTEWDETLPHTPEAERWSGWGSALKPAHEPIVVARKPLTGTVAQNVLARGTGAMNIDGCRIEGAPRTTHADGDHRQRLTSKGAQGGAWGNPEHDMGASDLVYEPRAGRWPANTILVHSGSCRRVGTRRVKAAQGRRGSTESAERGDRQGMFGIGATGEEVGYADADGMERVETWECVANCPVAALDAQSGELTSGANPTRRGSDKLRTAYGDFEGQRECVPARGGDSGGASRFFYTAKSSAAERNAGLDGFEERLKPTWSSGEANPGTFQADGTSKVARNVHPTVKPVAVMRWLVRLVTPPGGLVLDPFAGSGSTGIACVLEGFRFVGIEQQGPEFVAEHPGEPDYVALARARVGWWAEHGEDGLRIVREREARERRAEVARVVRADAGQLGLFGDGSS